MRLSANAIYEMAPIASGDNILLIMLPGARHTPQNLRENGFIQALRERNLPVDVLALDAHADLYLDRADIEQLLHQTLDAACLHGYRRIWLFGISLGGSGAMICATQRTAEIEGLFLLAPFLGTRGIVAEVEAAGGLADWRPGEIGNRDHERALLEQIRCSPIGSDEFPAVYLGFGREDRYRGASMLLLKRISPQYVVTRTGGHDWETWKGLWNMMLDKKPFVVSSKAGKWK
ncbi:alpha/beta hydrolase family protein [mine drainage metagenome]|jgi:pimeloyl-ACP methyl ester carboxylesterase|uniref:Alpha/beta hydrolase family protein n=1 Tax=mine drainage metagenome TaxID=410659 RepID=A0A1J5TI54_9ZZZZ